VRPGGNGKDSHQKDFIGKDRKGDKEYRNKDGHFNAFPAEAQISLVGYFL
jgi:hypothetical protein